MFLDSRLEHPAGWICARYKSSVLLLLLLLRTLHSLQCISFFGKNKISPTGTSLVWDNFPIRSVGNGNGAPLIGHYKPNYQRNGGWGVGKIKMEKEKSDRVQSSRSDENAHQQVFGMMFIIILLVTQFILTQHFCRLSWFEYRSIFVSEGLHCCIT